MPPEMIAALLVMTMIVMGFALIAGLSQDLEACDLAYRVGAVACWPILLVASILFFLAVSLINAPFALLAAHKALRARLETFVKEIDS